MSKTTWLMFTIWIVWLLTPQWALAAGRVECSAIKSRILSRPVRYCALLPASYDKDKSRRYPVLYYLHGLGDNEQTLVHSGGWDLVEHLQKSGKIGDFLIVTPDGGRSFYINSHDGQRLYEDFFIREFIPAIESKYRTRTGQAGRGISGTSMGGYGALRFAFKYPHLFSSVSAHSAALYEKLPPSLVAAVGVGGRGLDIGSAFGNPVNPVFWEKNTPFTLARAKAPRLSRLKIYFDCGDRDDYGFDAGARDLDRLLNSRGIVHEFHIYPGRHDWDYVITHFGESLEFQSRALKASILSPER